MPPSSIFRRQADDRLLATVSSLVVAVGSLLAGGTIGFTAGVLGIGGGLFAIPLLGLLLGMDQQMAQGTALIMVFPAVVVTLRNYNRHHRIDWRAAAVGGGVSMVFTWLGARLALDMDSSLLRQIYALFVLLIAIFYFYQTRKRSTATTATRSWPARPLQSLWWFVPVGMIGGLTGGVFGVGGSVVVVPLFTTLFGHRQIVAQGLGLSMVLPGNLIAITTYAWHGQVDWVAGVPLAIGGMMLVPYGVRLAVSLPERRLKRLFAFMLLVIMVLLLVSV
ncbi:MAG TPA: sulfite exporter TauE/SafE family protein [Burkholderiaceae bacterium]|nr:sulfite exporter TauE/SafE family protein [Burkholderiaceae bacterium]